MHMDERLDFDTENRIFRLKSTDPSRPNLVYHCQADDVSSRDRWTGCLRRQLQTQMDFLRALQAPIAYHNRMSQQSST
jgi:hypothetical protein